MDSCEKTFGVPKEYVTAILWIETKHGAFLGSHNLPSVFLSAAMSDRPEYVAENLRDLRKIIPKNSPKYKRLKRKLLKKSRAKAKWAINELIHLSKIWEKGIAIDTLKGSWAGAFGLSQFLPSSYNKWAIDGNGDGKIDLFNVEDAIFSVGNYLKSRDWKNPRSVRKAIYSYNHSSAYVNAVIRLAKKIKARER